MIRIIIDEFLLIKSLKQICLVQFWSSKTFNVEHYFDAIQVRDDEGKDSFINNPKIISIKPIFWPL